MKPLPFFYYVRDKGTWYYQSPFGKVICENLEGAVGLLVK